MAMLVSDETMWQLIVWATSPMDARDFGFSCKQHIAILASCRACRIHWQQLASIDPMIRHHGCNATPILLWLCENKVSS